MKILHTSDLHLGLRLHGVSLLEEQRAMVDSLLETAGREQVGAVLISGDVFDRAVSPPEALRLYNRLVTGLCGELGIPTVIIGPGTIQVAHQPNEHVDLEQLDQTLALDEAVLRAMLQ